MLFSLQPPSKDSNLQIRSSSLSQPGTSARILTKPTPSHNTLFLSIMGWQCCQCSQRSTDEQKSTCKAPCSHVKCSWCSVTVGKSALPNANAKKGVVGKSGAAQQPTAKPAEVKCSHCGKPHPAERCWKVYPELRPKQEKRWCEYCQSNRHAEGDCWAKDPSKRPSAFVKTGEPKLCSHCNGWGHLKEGCFKLRRCEYCQSTTHAAETCWKLHPELNPHLPPRPQCGECGKPHREEHCWVKHPELRTKFHEGRREKGKGKV